MATDWVGSCRLYGKDLEFYSNCNGKLLEVSPEEMQSDLCYEKITLTTGQKIAIEGNEKPLKLQAT